MYTINQFIWYLCENGNVHTRIFIKKLDDGCGKYFLRNTNGPVDTYMAILGKKAVKKKMLWNEVSEFIQEEFRRSSRSFRRTQRNELTGKKLVVEEKFFNKK